MTKKNILITGASRGMGFAIAKQLRGISQNLLLTAKSGDNLEKAIKDIAADSSATIHGLPCDLDLGMRSAETIASWCGSKIGALDVLILNAGYYVEGDLSNFNEQEFRRIFEGNFFTNYFITQKLLDLLKAASSAKVIIIGSTAAYEAYPMVPTYGVAKWALRGLAVNLRKELMSHEIGVTFLSPGATLTGMWEGEDVSAERLLAPDDIAVLVEAILKLSRQAVVEELIVRPMLGDMHE